VVIELIDHPQLQGSSLAVGRGVESVRQIRSLSARVDLGFQAREFLLVMDKLDTEMAADLKLHAAATIKPAHEIASDAEQPCDGLLIASAAKPAKPTSAWANASAVRSAAVAKSGVCVRNQRSTPIALRR
jgi:hypothetical protein